MKTNKLTVAHSTLGGGNYRSPEVTVTEIANEGVLCMSGNGSLQTFETVDGIEGW